MFVIVRFPSSVGKICNWAIPHRNRNGTHIFSTPTREKHTHGCTEELTVLGKNQGRQQGVAGAGRGRGVTGRGVAGAGRRRPHADLQPLGWAFGNTEQHCTCIHSSNKGWYFRELSLKKWPQKCEHTYRTLAFVIVKNQTYQNAQTQDDKINYWCLNSNVYSKLQKWGRLYKIWSNFQA